MQDLNDKNSGDSLTAAEWNEVPSEIQNVIEGLGITLSGGDLNQLGQGIAGYVVNGDFGTDSGAADAYVVTEIGGKQKPPAYTDGFRLSFRVGTTNTGASTVNAFGLGVKNIVYKSSALSAGMFLTGLIVNLVFDFANDRFELVPNLTETVSIDKGWVIGAPGAGSLGAGTLNVQNQIGIGVSTPSSIALHIEAAATEKLRLQSTSASGATNVVFHQTTTNRAEIKFFQTNFTLQLLSRYGRIEFNTDTAGASNLRGFVDSDGGLIWGAPGAGSLGAGTLNVENQIAIGASVDSGIAFFIENAASEKIRLRSTSTTGDIIISFYQTTTSRAFIQYLDTLDDLQIVSEFGRISFLNDSAGSATLSGYVDSDNGLVWGAPTGASQGAGTGNFENGVYEDGVKLPRMKSGNFTTASLATNATEAKTITHGLGTDNLIFFASAKGNTATDSWAIAFKLFNSSNGEILGPNSTVRSIGVGTGVSAGDVELLVRNAWPSGAQTITVYWTVVARD